VRNINLQRKIGSDGSESATFACIEDGSLNASHRQWRAVRYPDG
jgi:hypothetical protein